MWMWLAVKNKHGAYDQIYDMRFVLINIFVWESFRPERLHELITDTTVWYLQGPKAQTERGRCCCWRKKQDRSQREALKINMCTETGPGRCCVCAHLTILMRPPMKVFAINILASVMLSEKTIIRHISEQEIKKQLLQPHRRTRRQLTN